MTGDMVIPDRFGGAGYLIVDGRFGQRRRRDPERGEQHLRLADLRQPLAARGPGHRRRHRPRPGVRRHHDHRQLHGDQQGAGRHRRLELDRHDLAGPRPQAAGHQQGGRAAGDAAAHRRAGQRSQRADPPDQLHRDHDGHPAPAHLGPVLHHRLGRHLRPGAQDARSTSTSTPTIPTS